MTRPQHTGMNSTVNRGFNKPAPGLRPTQTNMNDGSGGQIHLHNQAVGVPNTTKGRAGYGALIQGGISGYRNAN